MTLFLVWLTGVLIFWCGGVAWSNLIENHHMGYEIVMASLLWPFTIFLLLVIVIVAIPLALVYKLGEWTDKLSEKLDS